jgi:dihydrofolate reductase
MPPPRFRAYLALSLDGFVATPDGGVQWLERFNSEALGYSSFLASIGTVVIGRATFEQALGFGGWGWPGKDVYVLTHRPLTSDTPRTQAWMKSPQELVAHLKAHAAPGDVWLLGGPRSLHPFRVLDAVDAYELYVIPILLGRGLPLFEPHDAPQNLSLVRHRALDGGVVELVYAPVRSL